jgi:hypothetical protein
VVFLCSIERTEPDVDLHTIFGAQNFWVRVDEAFKGATAGETFVLSQPNHDCAPKFKKGERVLLYLHRGDRAGFWEARSCDRSRPLDSAADDLLFLRALPGSASGNRLSGEVEQHNFSMHRSAALSGIHVTISAKDGSAFNAITNEDGVYEVYDLPPGKYKVDIEVPKGLQIYFPMITGPYMAGSRVTTVKLGSHSGVSVSFVLTGENKLNGRALYPEGRPLEAVCLDLESVLDRTERDALALACTNADGNQTMGKMTPGQDRGLDLRIPVLEDRARISGHMQFNDGTPVSKGNVIYVSKHGSYSERTQTTADGFFRLFITGPIDGEVHGEIMVSPEVMGKCPQFGAVPSAHNWPATLSTPPSVVSGKPDKTKINLRVQVPSCPAWPRS